MLKRIALLGLLATTVCADSPIQKQDEKIVAWDIHKVLCTEQKLHGYQCQPQEDVFALVKELDARGVKQVIASNISQKSLSILRSKYPHHFNYFDYSRSLHGDGIFSRKPHSKYFKKFLKKNVMIDPSHVIFFDDKPENVKGARKNNIDGQLFCNALQGRTILQRKGLL